MVLLRLRLMNHIWSRGFTKSYCIIHQTSQTSQTSQTLQCHARYELARAKERDDEAALRKDEDKRRIIIEEERRRRSIYSEINSQPFPFSKLPWSNCLTFDTLQLTAPAGHCIFLVRLLREHGRELKKFLSLAEIWVTFCRGAGCFCLWQFHRSKLLESLSQPQPTK